MGRPLSIKTKILRHNLGDTEEAKILYDEFCCFLLEKYGSVDKDYDENPTKRGAEWLDIHHVMEYELDDIARRTQFQKLVEKNAVWLKANEIFCTQIAVGEYWYILDDDKYEENYKFVLEYNKCKNDNFLNISKYKYSLNDLKPYNKKENLVYANKIEHFILHYLISSIRGKDYKAGGPHFLWDAAVSLYFYGFDADYLKKLQKNRKEFYSYLSPYEITALYKNLIDWNGLNIITCSAFWKNYKSAFNKYYEQKVSYFRDIVTLSFTLRRLGGGLKHSLIMEIKDLPFMYKDCFYDGKPAKWINGDIYDIDGKTVLKFSLEKILNKKTFSIPRNVVNIKQFSFPSNSIIKLKIPNSVKKIQKNTFSLISNNGENNFKKLKTIEYEGSKIEWDNKFSNVYLGDIELICKQ